MGATCSKDYNRGVNKRRRQKLAKYEAEKRAVTPQRRHTDGTPLNRSLSSVAPPMSHRSASPHLEFRNTSPSRYNRGPPRHAQPRSISQHDRILPRSGSSNTDVLHRPQTVQMINILLSQEIQQRTQLLHRHSVAWRELCRFAEDAMMNEPLRRAVAGLVYLESVSRDSIAAAEVKHRNAVLDFFEEDVVDTKLSIMVTAQSHSSVKREHVPPADDVVEGTAAPPQRIFNDFDWNRKSKAQSSAPARAPAPARISAPPASDVPRQYIDARTPNRPAPAPQRDSRTPTRAAPQPPPGMLKVGAVTDSPTMRNGRHRDDNVHLANMSEAKRQLLMDRLRNLQAQETAQRNSHLYEESMRFNSLRSLGNSKTNFFVAEDALSSKMERQRRLISESKRNYGHAAAPHVSHEEAGPSRTPPPAPGGDTSFTRNLEGVSQLSANNADGDQSLRDASVLAFQQRLQALSGRR